MDTEMDQRSVLDPQPIFNGQHLVDTKVFEGETLQALLERSDEARQICGIAPGQDMSQYTFEQMGEDGLANEVGLQHGIQANGQYLVAPANFIRAA